MMGSRFDELTDRVKVNPKRWVVTGVAGFIGSNLLEALLKLDQTAIGLDNFSTGYPKNLDDVRKKVGEVRWKNFSFFGGDVRNLEDCRKAGM